MLAVDEAQKIYPPAALEELRWLNGEHARAQERNPMLPFGLLLCGDDDLPPLLALNTQRA